MRLHLLAALAVASISTCAEAQCQGSLLSTNTSSSLNLLMVTMNRLGAASYASGTLNFRRAIVPLKQPAHWQSVAPLSQTFNDRYAASNPNQNFDIAQADKISLQFTIGANPQGTITLNSHAGVTSTFPITCSNTGIVHGVTGDVEYLFYFSVQQPIQ